MSSSATAALEDMTQEEQAATVALAESLRVGLQPQRCLSTEEALAAIQAATLNADLGIIAGAIDLIEGEPWCESVRAAIASADEAALLAMASSTGATGGVLGAGPPPSVPFGAGGIGSPGGGGGSGYP